MPEKRRFRWTGSQMTTLPVVILVTAAAALGAYLLLLWFRNARKPVLIGFHVLLGLGGAETLVVFLHGSDLGEGSAARRVVLIAGAFLAAAIASGFLAPVIGRSYRVAANSLLAAHVASGLAGLLIVLVFVSRM
jgi:hypothetical protein